MIFGLFQILSPYLEVKYFRTEQEVKEAKPENIADADIMNGYVKSTKEEQLELAKKKMISMVVKENGEEEQVVQNTLDQISSSGKSIDEMSDAIGEIYGYPGGYSLRYYYEGYEYHQGTVDEINAELKAKLSEYSYSWYFGRKFADFGGLYLTFSARFCWRFSLSGIREETLTNCFTQSRFRQGAISSEKRQEDFFQWELSG